MVSLSVHRVSLSVYRVSLSVYIVSLHCGDLAKGKLHSAFRRYLQNYLLFHHILFFSASEKPLVFIKWFQFPLFQVDILTP